MHLISIAEETHAKNGLTRIVGHLQGSYPNFVHVCKYKVDP